MDKYLFVEKEFSPEGELVSERLVSHFSYVWFPSYVDGKSVQWERVGDPTPEQWAQANR